MNKTTQQYKDYLFSSGDEGQYAHTFFKIEQDHFASIIEQILTNYGLAEQLRSIQTTGGVGSIFDLGCGEGLYLHVMAELLEKHQLLNATRLTGLDINQMAIATALEYSRVSKPPRPYLNFITHDITQPFENNLALRASATIKCNFIYCLQTLEYLPMARNHLERLYQLLEPGGTIYLSNVITKYSEDAIQSPHPLLEPMDRFFIQSLSSLNEGEPVALQVGKWLEELGATQIQSTRQVFQVGGKTEQGAQLLRLMIHIYRATTPRQIEQGILTKAQVEKTLADLFQELDANSQGQLVHTYTLARKPL